MICMQWVVGAGSCHTDAPPRASPDQVTVHLQLSSAQLSSALIVIVIVLDPGDGSRGPKAEQSAVLTILAMNDH